MPLPRRTRKRPLTTGHSLIEILVAVTIIIILAALVISALVKLRNIVKAWKGASAPPAPAAVETA